MMISSCILGASRSSLIVADALSFVLICKHSAMSKERGPAIRSRILHEVVLSPEFLVVRDGGRSNNGFGRRSDTDASSLQQVILKRIMDCTDFFVDVEKSLLMKLRLDSSISPRLRSYPCAMYRKHRIYLQSGAKLEVQKARLLDTSWR